MNKIRKLLFACATTFALSGAAFAAPVHVDFSFSTASGTLTFNDGIGDLNADAVSLTSDNFGESGVTFNLFYNNIFTWAGNQVSTANFLAQSTAPSQPRYTIELFQYNSDLYCSATAFDLCPGDKNSIYVFGTRATFVTQTAAVPLPAGMPMVLTGLAGLVGLRLRKKSRAVN